MDTSNLHFICRFVGGSSLYGLQTPNSDVDDRGIYIYDTPEKILGLRCGENGAFSSPTGSEEDYSYKEIRHFLQLLKGGNTEAIEVLFADKSIFTTLHPLLEERLRSNPHAFIDSKQLFVVLRGYMNSERGYANGQRTGKLGGKRKEAIETYGYSPKNFVQLIRLGTIGCEYFKTGAFPVNIRSYNKELADELLDIKVNPGNHTVEELNKRCDDIEEKLAKTFEMQRVITRFNEQRANNLLRELYSEYLTKDS